MPSFPEALRRALRMDPDVILVGEMRDLETIHAAITAAETGPHGVRHAAHHRCPGHGRPHHRRVSRRTSRNRSARSLSAAIIGVLVQALLPRKPKGLVAAYEMLVVTPAIANLIREARPTASTRRFRPAASTACSCWTTPCSTCGGSGSVRRRDVVMQVQSARRTEGAHRTTPRRASSTRKTRTKKTDEDEDDAKTMTRSA